MSLGIPQGGQGWPGVVCAGLYSSGSTWAFNVAAGLLQHAFSGRVAPFYADCIDDRALHAIRQACAFVLKTHQPAASVRSLCLIDAVPIILTIRDPRDAVASLMQRFDQDFAAALGMVERSAHRLLHLSECAKPLVLRYEERFTDKGGVAQIGNHLRIKSDEVEKRLTADLSRELVASRIEKLINSGVLQRHDPLNQWERGTEWHPFHIGDGRTGKYRDILSRGEAERTIFATRPFCIAFGYLKDTAQTAVSVGGRQSDGELEGWIDHFIAPDLICGWARLLRSKYRLELVVRYNGVEVGSAFTGLYRQDLVAIGDAHAGFQLRLSVPVTLNELLGAVELEARHNGATIGRVYPTAELITRALGSTAPWSART